MSKEHGLWAWTSSDGREEVERRGMGKERERGRERRRIFDFSSSYEWETLMKGKESYRRL